jgi:hopanoid biosynthesis associated protein HpnK
VSKSVVITGDDFGLALPVNEAIEEAHQRGVLTNTSLLVGSPFSDDAVMRARRNPRLHVGLHIAVCEGIPVLTPDQIPDLVNGRGELRSPVRAAVGFFLRPRVRDQLRREIRAQFEAFRATGLTLDHVNGHNNMQLHPVVMPILLSVAREYGARAIRLPVEPLRASLRAARSSGALAPGTPRRARCPAWLRFLQWLGMRPWGAYAKQRYRQAGFAVNDYVFGIYDCGGMDLDLFLGVVENLPNGVSEIHCHPATRRCPEIDGPMPDYQHESELAALVNPSLRDALAASGVTVLEGYSDLSARGCDRTTVR